MATLPDLRFSDRRVASLTRVLLSYYVASGLVAAAGLFLIAGGVRWGLGSYAAALASIGVIVVVPPDAPAPRRGKLWQLLPAVLVAIPLFFVVRILHADRLELGLLLVPATFMAFLAAAWGRRGIPVSMSAMFAIVFSMAVPGRGDVGALASTGYFSIGAIAYLCYALAANSMLNAAYRVQMLADSLLTMGALIRALAVRFTESQATVDGAVDPLGVLLRRQAELADQLQVARNILLESPRTARRRQLAGMLLHILEMRDHVLACELDVDEVARTAQATVLTQLRSTLLHHADALEELADYLLWGRQPPVLEADPQRLRTLTADMLARGLAARVGNISVEVARLSALARGESEPDLVVVRAYWQMFVSPTGWSWQPFAGVWHWDAPPLRHALRAALAIGSAYLISLGVPWGTHAYWILLTIVVVLRGSLAQTLERRNARVAGTLLGSVMAGALLSVNTPVAVLTLIVTLAQGAAHAFAVKRYLVTAVAATVLALVQAHLLNVTTSPAFEVVERILDTFIGVAIAWAFSYVLPAWERTQIPALIDRTLQAQAGHAHSSLALGQLTAVDDRPELEWRLARREAYDSLSALVQATQRCLAEPRAVRPPLEPLVRLLAHSYQLLAQLTAIKGMLLLRRGHLDVGRLAAPLARAEEEIEGALRGLDAPDPSPHAARAALSDAFEPGALSDPFGIEVTPWLIRRLASSAVLARDLRTDAQGINSAMDADTL